MCLDVCFNVEEHFEYFILMYGSHFFITCKQVKCTIHEKYQLAGLHFSKPSQRHLQFSLVPNYEKNENRKS